MGMKQNKAQCSCTFWFIIFGFNVVV